MQYKFTLPDGKEQTLTLDAPSEKALFAILDRLELVRQELKAANDLKRKEMELLSNNLEEKQQAPKRTASKKKRGK